jgi:hypothetical protein
MKRLLILTLVGLTACGSAQAAETTAAPTTEAPATTEAPETEITLADFEVSLVTLDSECFDSAGGLVTVEADLAINGGTYPGKATLVYEIHGGEHVETHSLELEDDRYSTDQNTVSTASCSAHLTAIPVNLIER